MRKVSVLFFLVIVITIGYTEEIVTLGNGSKIIIFEDHTWKEYTKDNLSLDEIIIKNRNNLRPGINASNEDISIACELFEQGWKYTMPRPKSSKAAWGVTDGRTTWYNGWWYNSLTNQYSRTTPTRSSSGLFLGDGQNSSNSWSNGGSPSRPDIYMFLLSDSGGPRF